MQASKTAETLGVRLSRYPWFQALTARVFGPTVHQIVDTQINEILSVVFQRHRQEFDYFDRRIMERFDTGQDILAQNVAKLRKEQREGIAQLRDEMRVLRNQVAVRQGSV